VWRQITTALAAAGVELTPQGTSSARTRSNDGDPVALYVLLYGNPSRVGSLGNALLLGPTPAQEGIPFAARGLALILINGRREPPRLGEQKTSPRQQSGGM